MKNTTIYECPNCHADNQDMFEDIGDDTILCTACDHEFKKESENG